MWCACVCVCVCVRECVSACVCVSLTSDPCTVRPFLPDQCLESVNIDLHYNPLRENGWQLIMTDLFGFFPVDRNRVPVTGQR